MRASMHVVDSQGRSVEFRGKQCHVYMVLPNETLITTAGRFKVELDKEGLQQGCLVVTAQVASELS